MKHQKLSGRKLSAAISRIKIQMGGEGKSSASFKRHINNGAVKILAKTGTTEPLHL